MSEDSQHSQVCLKYYSLCLTTKRQSLLREQVQTCFLCGEGLVAQKPLVASSFSLYPLKEKNLGESLVSGRRQWWPPHGTVKVKCPYKKVDLSWFIGTVNPCPGLYQPICGTNFVTYENPCILCIESLKSRGEIRFQNDGKC
ncbi:serine protease inhibitor Kazal-type 14 [Callorhinus ursinus]|uniref:Serine protease inhibitor Kazal-type 14-like n=2 Tax=Otariidae TaxID=9702 RepID=A0A3Q7S3W7_CALUR|nr:serine protease inhibitor Kazal-type 14-like [Callorhinus ursinus]XP_027460228.1 serine protease inhibitor Kazal-type 14 [Zalophus californianus]XP_027974886.1 serine protease inhibitor Kazal-type 14 [Eumetopias jubatus]